MTDPRPGLAGAPGKEPFSWAERLFLKQLQALDMAGWQVEYLFVADRNWRFDFAWPEQRIAVEIMGMSNKSCMGHQALDRFRYDCEKLNRAALEGWVVLRGTTGMVKNGDLLDDTVQMLFGRAG